MSDPNQPSSYPGPAQPSSYPPPPPGYPPPPPGYGQPQYPVGPYPVPQYPTGPAYPQFQSPPPSPYAHWGYRFGAYLLDLVLLVPFYFAAVVGATLVDDQTLTEDTHTLGWVVLGVALVSLFGFSLWNAIIRQGRTGSSLGKQWVGITVISEETGTPIGGWRTLGRSLLHVLDSLPCYLGYLWPLWDDKRQTFADKIMTTVVVKRVPAPAAYPVPPVYPPAPGYPQT